MCGGEPGRRAAKFMEFGVGYDDVTRCIAFLSISTENDLSGALPCQAVFYYLKVYVQAQFKISCTNVQAF